MPESNQTEKATPKRRKKAREQGQIARSRDLPAVLSLGGVAVTVAYCVTSMGAHWRSLYVFLLTSATRDDVFPQSAPFLSVALETLRWIVPALLVAFLLALSGNLAQGGVTIAPAALQFKFERLSPARRFGQIFSVTSLSALLKSLIPFSAILLLGINAIRDHWALLVRASGADVRGLSSLVVEIALTIAWKSAIVLLLWAAVDYFFVLQQSERELRMSHEEIKQEYKENDGNPHTKGQVRKLQRAMRKRRSLQAAASATLVVMNPTHFAVALKYEPTMAAPEVVAKGRDLLALKIKQIALDNGVAVMENKPLAQALYKSVEVGDSIPAQLYQAVAEVLVIVFRAEAELREQERLRRSRNASGGVIPTL